MKCVFSIPGAFKRERKRYLDDPSVPVPKRTIRWREKKANDSLKHTCTEDTNVTGENQGVINSPAELNNKYDIPEKDDSVTPVCSTGELSEAMNLHGGEYSSESDYSYENDSASELGSIDETSNESSENLSYSDFSDVDMSENEEKYQTPNGSKKILSESESQAFCLVSYILKYNLSASAGKDLLKLLQTLYPESEYFRQLKYEHLLKNTCDNDPMLVHYCCVCQNRFPDDPDIFRCTINECTGLRYVGPVLSQTLSNREP